MHTNPTPTTPTTRPLDTAGVNLTQTADLFAIHDQNATSAERALLAWLPSGTGGPAPPSQLQPSGAAPCLPCLPCLRRYRLP